MKDKLLLIDGNNILFGSAKVMSNLKNHNDVPTGGFFGFVRTLKNFMKDYQRDEIIVLWDSGKTWRSEFFSGYKGQRPPSTEISQQRKWLTDFLECVGISQAYEPGYEADDIACTYVHRNLGENPEIEITLVSSDKDWFQFLLESNVAIFNPFSKKYINQSIFQELGVSGPEQFLEMKAVVGDVADNIPGVKGIGEKTFAAFLAGSCSPAKKTAIKGFMDSEQFRINYNLMNLLVPTAQNIVNLEGKNDLDKAHEILVEVGARTIAKTLRQDFG